MLLHAFFLLPLFPSVQLAGVVLCGVDLSLQVRVLEEESLLARIYVANPSLSGKASTADLLRFPQAYHAMLAACPAQYRERSNTMGPGSELTPVHRGFHTANPNQQRLTSHTLQVPHVSRPQDAHRCRHTELTSPQRVDILYFPFLQTLQNPVRTIIISHLI